MYRYLPVGIERPVVHAKLLRPVPRVDPNHGLLVLLRYHNNVVILYGKGKQGK